MEEKEIYGALELEAQRLGAEDRSATPPHQDPMTEEDNYEQMRRADAEARHRAFQNDDYDSDSGDADSEEEDQDWELVPNKENDQAIPKSEAYGAPWYKKIPGLIARTIRPGPVLAAEAHKKKTP